MRCISIHVGFYFTGFDCISIVCLINFAHSRNNQKPVLQSKGCCRANCQNRTENGCSKRFRIPRRASRNSGRAVSIVLLHLCIVIAIRGPKAREKSVVKRDTYYQQWMILPLQSLLEHRFHMIISRRCIRKMEPCSFL